MGVTSLGASSGRPHSMTEIYNLTAETQPPLASSNVRGMGSVVNRFLPGFSTSNLAFEGTSSAPGFAGNGFQSHSYRYLIIYGTNCQVNISYPSSGMGSTAWNGSSYIPQSRTYLTASESANGYRLYCKAINYTNYSYIQLTANNFDYGYSAGSWVWYNAAGQFQSATAPSASFSLYSSDYTSSSYIILRQAASS